MSLLKATLSEGYKLTDPTGEDDLSVLLKKVTPFVDEDMEEAEAGDMEEEEEGQGLAIRVERRVTCRENVPREVAGVEGVVVDMVEAVEDMEVEGVVVAMEEEDMGEAVVATNQIKDLLLRFF